MTFPRSPQHRLYRFVQSFALRFDQYQWGIPTGIFGFILPAIIMPNLYSLLRLFLILTGIFLIGRSTLVKAYYEAGKGRRELRRKRKEIKLARKKMKKEEKRQKKNLTPPV
jgi:Sec-independent protein translocase protein TatA